MLYIGIDLGTSSVKLLLMDEKGKVENIVSREYPLYFPYPGWSEQNPEDWYRETICGLKELMNGFDASKGSLVLVSAVKCMGWLFWTRKTMLFVLRYSGMTEGQRKSVLI